MSTVQTIVDAAFATSFENRPNTIATSATELVNVVDRKFKQIYAAAAKANPAFFLNVATVPFVSSGWAKPASCQLLVRMEAADDNSCLTLASVLIPAGTEIIVVPYDDRTAEPLLPALFFVAGQYKRAGNTGDPAQGNITFYFSRRPTTLAALSDGFDALWDETYNPILILDLASYLAQKDHRPDDARMFSDQSDAWMGLLLDYVGTEAVNEVRRNGIPRTALWKGVKTVDGQTEGQ